MVGAFLAELFGSPAVIIPVAREPAVTPIDRFVYQSDEHPRSRRNRTGDSEEEPTQRSKR